MVTTVLFPIRGTYLLPSVLSDGCKVSVWASRREWQMVGRLVLLIIFDHYQNKTLHHAATSCWDPHKCLHLFDFKKLSFILHLIFVCYIYRSIQRKTSLMTINIVSSLCPKCISCKTVHFLRTLPGYSGPSLTSNCSSCSAVRKDILSEYLSTIKAQIKAQMEVEGGTCMRSTHSQTHYLNSHRML